MHIGDRLVGDTMQYPMNIAKFRLLRLCAMVTIFSFVMLGAPVMLPWKKGDEAALESAAENNQIAIDIIDGYFK